MNYLWGLIACSSEPLLYAQSYNASLSYPDNVHGYLFYHDLRQYGHFSWRKGDSEENGQRCSFQLDECVHNPLGAWGMTAQAHSKGKLLAETTVAHNGSFWQ